MHFIINEKLRSTKSFMTLGHRSFCLRALLYWSYRENASCLLVRGTKKVNDVYRMDEQDRYLIQKSAKNKHSILKTIVSRFKE